ncbi:probable endonuclease 4 [Argopecten irradians]|uniref:probable endonuclease 4 n=1 Tax=Argopecten irradians TaxID=31199 RepID=UPI00371E1084
MVRGKMKNDVVNQKLEQSEPVNKQKSGARADRKRQSPPDNVKIKEESEEICVKKSRLSSRKKAITDDEVKQDIRIVKEPTIYKCVKTLKRKVEVETDVTVTVKKETTDETGVKKPKRKVDVETDIKVTVKEICLKKSRFSPRKKPIIDKVKNDTECTEVIKDFKRIEKEPTSVTAVKKPKRKVENVKTEPESEVVEKEDRQKKGKKSKQTAKSPVKGKSKPIGGKLPAVSNFNLAIHKCEKHVGAHVSIAGGLYHAVEAAVSQGATAFGMFLKSQRQWNAKPLEDKDAEKFKEAYRTAGFSPGDILPHGSYLMNCGSANPETLQKSRDTLVDELQRCEKLGLTLYNFHPGSSCGDITTEQSLSLIAESINMAHTKTKFVITVIENMSCQGSTVGGKFEELKAIIDKVKNKSRIGVCLDTCHAFAAGHDLSSQSGFEKMMAEFEKVVGFKYLKALHLNDSKGALGCHLDRHENIGRGHIGIEGFRRVMCDRRFNHIPMILETPFASDDIYTKEIKLLHSICKTK